MPTAVVCGVEWQEEDGEQANKPAQCHCPVRVGVVSHRGYLIEHCATDEQTLSHAHSHAGNYNEYIVLSRTQSRSLPL